MKYTFKNKEIAKNTPESNNFLMAKFKELFKKRTNKSEKTEETTENINKDIENK